MVTLPYAAIVDFPVGDVCRHIETILIRHGVFTTAVAETLLTEIASWKVYALGMILMTIGTGIQTGCMTNVIRVAT